MYTRAFLVVAAVKYSFQLSTVLLYQETLFQLVSFFTMYLC